METHEKISDIQSRVERYKNGDRDAAVTLVRFDLPFLIKLIYGLSQSLDSLCRENHLLRSRLCVYNHHPLRIVDGTEFDIDQIINSEDTHGQGAINEEALAQRAEAQTA